MGTDGMAPQCRAGSLSTNPAGAISRPDQARERRSGVTTDSDPATICSPRRRANCFVSVRAPSMTLGATRAVQAPSSPVAHPRSSWRSRH